VVQVEIPVPHLLEIPAAPLDRDISCLVRLPIRDGGATAAMRYNRKDAVVWNVEVRNGDVTKKTAPAGPYGSGQGRLLILFSGVNL